MGTLKRKNCIILVLASAFQAVGIRNIHALADITEGGTLGATLLLEKEQASGLEQSVTLAESVSAPVCRGDVLGTLTVKAGEDTVAEIPLLAGEEVEIPEFVFKIGKRVWNGHKLKLHENTVIIVEGLHALNPVMLPAGITLLLFLCKNHRIILRFPRKSCKHLDGTEKN